MNKLSVEERAKVVSCLVEGNSIRATVRMTGIAKNTVSKLLVELGAACSAYQNDTLRNLSCKRVQCDEIWAFVGAKEANASPEQKAEGWGDAWTWTALCPDTKLIICWHVGSRGMRSAYDFIQDLSERLTNRVQLTTDGHKPYLAAVESAFGSDVDYAQSVKVFKADASKTEVRYSAPEFVRTTKRIITGNPLKKHISTSYTERQNLTMRMSIRRFTRLTNAFSKKLANHEASVALYFMYYNFCRIHQTLRVTPAMEAGITDHVWSLEEVIGLLNG
jgi:IS1 family transposase